VNTRLPARELSRDPLIRSIWVKIVVKDGN
jgi:hypothetical protein